MFVLATSSVVVVVLLSFFTPTWSFHLPGLGLVSFIIWFVTSVGKYHVISARVLAKLLFLVRTLGDVYKPLFKPRLLCSCFSDPPMCVSERSSSSSLAGNTHTHTPTNPLLKRNRKQPYPVNGAKRIHRDRSKVISALVTKEIGHDTCEELFEGEILKDLMKSQSRLKREQKIPS